MTGANIKPIHVIGGGLAGSESAWAAARVGVPVVLHEMRPNRKTAAHQTQALAELVCSNSMRSDDATTNAVGLLHEEMRAAGSLIMACADKTAVPAGGALAVDRDGFAKAVTSAIEAEELISINRAEVAGIPPAEWDSVIVATGPLTSPSLADAIDKLTGEDSLAFYDAIAPIVYKDSIDFDIAWMQSRYDKGGPAGDLAAYVNCPMNESQYNTFIDALVLAETTEFKKWENSTPYFEGCLPIEVMAARGQKTLSFGPMKPVGLTDPRTSKRAHAVVQLRQDNALGTLYNMVGFQTKMKHGEQTRILRTIPGLENARFARLGGIHRNTFLNSPRLLDRKLRLKTAPRLRFAGQITGVEGYVESAAIGLLAGHFAAAERKGVEVLVPPPTSSHGALLNHITGGHITGRSEAATFQPMNANFGLFPELTERTEKGRPIKGKARRESYCKRGAADFNSWLASIPTQSASQIR